MTRSQREPVRTGVAERQRCAARRQPTSASGRALPASEWKRIGAIVDFLPGRGAVLGRLRAGGIDPQPVRRSLHATGGVRLRVPVVLVPVRAANLRDRSRARVRVAVASASVRATRRCRRNSRSACSSWRFVPASSCPRGDGSERRRLRGEPDVARGVLLRLRSSASCASARSA